MEKYIKTFEEFINTLDSNSTLEKIDKAEDKKYDYCCLMLNVKHDHVIDINEDDVYQDDDGGFGVENNPHITLLYGIHDTVSVDDIESFIKKNIDYIDDVKLTGISCFKNDVYDVLKYDVDSETLHMLNKKLTNTFPYTTNYPNYIPHLSIAYLQKGEGEKYCQKFETPISTITSTLVYSMTNGDKKTFDID